MRERHRFARAGARYHQQGTCTKPTPFTLLAVLGGKPLRRIQKAQMIKFLLGNLHATPP
jgi:hypothetical protein